MTISKDIEVSTGHRLHKHNGGCFNLHGHNYQIKVHLVFLEDDKYIITDKEEGFYIDFSDIKTIINDYLDHQFLVYENDDLLDVLKDLPGVRVVEYIPTVENIAFTVKNLISNFFKKQDKEYVLLDEVKIEIYETKNSKCKF
jgi:6-pyruvoyl-tetrahydropterin synthase